MVTKNKRRVDFCCMQLLLAVSLLFILSCNQKKEERKIERSFYYWRSVFHLSAFEEQQLKQLNVKLIYVKFFDVAWDETVRQPVPVAKLQSANYKLPAGIQVIPTVFITNECIERLDSSQVNSLATKLTRLVMSIDSANAFSLQIPEIQIDCDWTPKTKEKYFALLKAIKINSHVSISATIRLHQVKFTLSAGIPPVDKGLLMCYNMGNLKKVETKNSIIETEELKKYIGKLNAYPLPLDVALPLFDWKVLFRNNEYSGLIQNLPDGSLSGSFIQKRENWYELLKDTLLQGYSLKKGDMLRSEESNYASIIAVAEEVSKRLKNTHPRVALYHLDSLLLSKYSPHELENIYNSIR